MKLTDYTSYADAQQHFSKVELWKLFDGSAGSFNIAHECVDRHANSGNDALIILQADGRDEILGYEELSVESSQFAQYLKEEGCNPGDRIAIMLEPSREFYVAMFGVLKLGAIVVPLFTLFGPDGIRLRVQDCSPSVLITSEQHVANVRAASSKLKVMVLNSDRLTEMRRLPSSCRVSSRADALAVLQYTSGTTRELPEAVRHSHGTLVTLMVAGLYGTGIRPGDRFICPSSPAWGHGLWHGTFAPLALGLTVGAYSGKFDPERLLHALQDHRFTNMSAAATHYRMIRHSGRAGDYRYYLEKLSFTGEPIDSETADFVRNTFGHEVCSMYGTTEMGVVLVNYPGARDLPTKRGALGRPTPGGVVQVQSGDGSPCEANVIGHLMVYRRNQWIPTRDLAYVDADGYFYHAGRADDVIISAGWTMSAVEIENVILTHPDVKEAAVIGISDELRGQIVKAFIVSDRDGDGKFSLEIQHLVKEKLSQHEYPRHVEFTSGLPKTPAGKINRKSLRDVERQTITQATDSI